MKVKSEGKTMHPLPTKVLVDSVYCIGDGVANMYLIKTKDKYIAFDAGQNVKKIQSELKGLSVDCSKVIAVFLTHSDRDHIAALELFKNAKVYLSKAEKTMVDQKKRRLAIFHNKLPERQYITLNDCEVVNTGGAYIEGILTPGHTTGSMCYLVNGRDLFTGDAFSFQYDETKPFNDFFNMNTKESIESLKKIKGLETAQYFFTGHYGFGEYDRLFRSGE